MDTLVDTHDFGAYRVEIHYDYDSESPRTAHDNVGKMVTFDKRSRYGDEQHSDPAQYLVQLCVECIGPDFTRWLYRREDETPADVEWFEDDEVAYRALEDGGRRLLAQIEQKYVILGLTIREQSYATISSSRDISIYTRNRPDGFILCTMEQVQREWGVDVEKAREYLEGEVETYDQWLTGQCYGYVVLGPPDYDEDGDEIEDSREELDSCWGFLGDTDYCLAEAKGMVDYHLTKPLPRERSLVLLAA